MPGRVRTTLKRIAAWEERAEQFYKEIRQRIPEAYVEYDNDYQRFEDPWGLVQLDDVPHYDPVADAWKSTVEAAERLREQLIDLEIGILQRLDRKGLRLDRTPPGAQLDIGDLPEAIDKDDPLGG